MYREQVVTLEDDVARLREQDDLKNDDFNVCIKQTSQYPAPFLNSFLHVFWVSDTLPFVSC